MHQGQKYNDLLTEVYKRYVPFDDTFIRNKDGKLWDCGVMEERPYKSNQKARENTLSCLKH